MSKIEPVRCRFCKCEVEVEELWNGSHHSFRVECDRGHCLTGPVRATRHTAVRAWNAVMEVKK